MCSKKQASNWIDIWQHWERENLEVVNRSSLGSTVGNLRVVAEIERVLFSPIKRLPCITKWLPCVFTKETWRGWGSLPPESSQNRFSKAPSLPGQDPCWRGASRSATKLSRVGTWGRKEREAGSKWRGMEPGVSENRLLYCWTLYQKTREEGVLWSLKNYTNFNLKVEEN